MKLLYCLKVFSLLIRNFNFRSFFLFTYLYFDPFHINRASEGSEDRFLKKKDTEDIDASYKKSRLNIIVLQVRARENNHS